jgi:hypothetical protein
MPSVNIACINKPFNAGTIAAMHPSYIRLLAAAKEATANTKQPISRPSDLARHMTESPQRIHNWQVRGVSKEGALKAETLYGVSANYVLEGAETKPTAAPQKNLGAPDEPVQLDHSEKTEGLGLNEFLNYLNSLYPQAALSPEEVIEEAEAYREYASKRVANRILKQKFQAPGAVPDARVEAAYAEAQRRERRQATAPEKQLIDSPMAGQQRRSTDKKSGTS